MYTRELLYELLLGGARPLLRLAAPFHDKLREGLAGRGAAVASLEEWAAQARDPARPLVWLHAPSVGEALMAQAVIGALRERRPDVQVVFTYFSPSAVRIAGRVGADHSTYLPWDLARESRRALTTLRPSVLAFVRTEIWPVLAREAAAAGVRLALVNAVLAPGSSRLRGPARYLLGPGYGRLDAVGAVAPGDGERLVRLGIPRERVQVTGDARFDQVWARVSVLGGERAREERPLLRRLHDPDRLTLVAGSTWPEDEARLLPAYVRAREKASFRLIVAPHEPTPAHLAGVEARLRGAGLPHGRLAEVEGTTGPFPEVVVVDRVGVLAELYAIADIAYVGGGFGGAGLHSVVEPAALGVPVLYGPRFGNALEADALSWAGGGTVVSGVEAIAHTLRRLARDSVLRLETGAAAQTFVRSRLGGAARNAELLERLLPAPPMAAIPAANP
jgi:3-deoxy-D-manno-octulosonic-acid transferase